MKLFRILFIGLFLFGLFPAVSQAEEGGLKVSDVASFLSYAEALEPLSEEMEENNIPHFFQVRPLDMTGKGVPSHEKAVEQLRNEYPAYYEKTAAVIASHMHDGQHYYSNPESWAQVADKVILAFYTSRSDGSDQSFEAISAKVAPLKQIAKMDPKMEEQLSGMLEMLEGFTQVSDADKQVVRQFHEQLTIHFAQYPQR